MHLFCYGHFHEALSALNYAQADDACRTLIWKSHDSISGVSHKFAVMPQLRKYFPTSLKCSLIEEHVIMIISLITEVIFNYKLSVTFRRATCVSLRCQRIYIINNETFS